jgi:hypothetical protein
VFKAGDKVFHMWGHPDMRPRHLDEDFIKDLGFNSMGMIMAKIDDPSFDTSEDYWLVDIGDELVEWREDLIMWIV